MKKIKILIALLLVVSLCGCADKNNSSQGDDRVVSVPNSSGADVGANSAPQSSAAQSEAVSSTPESTAAESRGDDPAPSEPEVSAPPAADETFLVGLAGDKIRFEDISTVITSDGGECSPEELTEERFSAVLCSGFAYIAEPQLTARNDRDNADVYDEANMAFTDTSSAPLKNYKRLNVGDTVCGLTLREAEVNFARGAEQTVFDLNDGSQKTGAELGLPEIYFTHCSAKFDGEIEMTGYISRSTENVYNIAVGDIIFVPCDGEGNFPVMSYRLNGDDGFFHALQTYAVSDLTWQNEFGYLYLGNEANTSADISDIPDDGTFIKARVTVDNFELNCGVNFVNITKAEIVDVEAL